MAPSGSTTEHVEHLHSAVMMSACDTGPCGQQ